MLQEEVVPYDLLGIFTLLFYLLLNPSSQAPLSSDHLEGVVQVGRAVRPVTSGHTVDQMEAPGWRPVPPRTLEMVSSLPYPGPNLSNTMATWRCVGGATRIPGHTVDHMG